MSESNEPGTAFRWPVSVTHSFPVSAQALWTLISTQGNLELCHPFCESNPVESWPGPESRDTIHYLSGWVYERRFLRWLEGVGYDLEIGERGGPTSHVSWRIAPLEDDLSELTIEVRPHVLQPVPVALRWIPHLTVVRPRLRTYLTAVLRGFEWYLVRGEPVPRNQFGTHPWFS